MDFQNACRNNNLALAKQLYALGKANENKNTQLFWAAYNGNLEMVQWLCSIGADMYAKSGYGMSALTYSCNKGHLEVAKWIYAQGDTDIQESSLYTALYPTYRSDVDDQTAFKLLEWLLNIKKFDNRLMNTEYSEMNMKSAKLIFDNCYTATSEHMKVHYDKYKKDRKNELKTVIMDEYMIPNLWNIVYDY